MSVPRHIPAAPFGHLSKPLMLSPWRLLRFVPEDVLRYIKRRTPASLRFWIRQRFGANSADIPDTVVRVADGRKFRVGPDPAYWPIYYGVGYEPEASAIARHFLRPGDTAIDIGANIGWFTTLFGARVGPTGHVFAFEPVVETLERLRTNVSLNDLSERVSLETVALSERSGVETVYVFREESLGLASMSPQDRTDFETRTVHTETLDEYATRSAIGGCTLLKCDVEGAELSVLRGGRNFLLRPDAPWLLLELNEETFRHFGYSSTMLFAELATLGYDLFYGIRTNTELVRVNAAADVASFAAGADRNRFGVVPGLLFCGKRGSLEPRLAGLRVEQS